MVKINPITASCRQPAMAIINRRKGEWAMEDSDLLHGRSNIRGRDRGYYMMIMNYEEHLSLLKQSYKDHGNLEPHQIESLFAIIKELETYIDQIEECDGK